MQHAYICRKAAVIFLLSLLICTAGGGCALREEAARGIVVIEGDAVESKAYLTLDELKSMDEGLVEADYFSINSYGTKEYTRFKGVWVWHILKEKVKIKENASKVTFIAEDGYSVEFSLDDVKRENYIDEQNPKARYKMILAWEENGKEINPANGNPFQLVVGQRKPGDVNKPYWVRNVKTIRID
ncbi:molybdopterin-dependent oxidoreductase [Thermovorax subterraneus]|nr:molybdopterin-dependent oxidoreductase [Thermovorax subterraneus]